MNDSSQFDPKTSFGLLLQGPPGGGKTSLAYCFPKPAFINSDNNLGGVVRRARSQGFDVKFKYGEPTKDDKGVAITTYTGQWKRFLTLLSEAASSPDVETVVLDNLSSFSEIGLHFLIEEAKRLEGKTIERLRIQDYQPNQMMWKEICTRLRNTGKLVIVIAHEEAEKDEVTGVVKYKPNIPGAKLQGQFGGMFSDIWRCETKLDGKGNPQYVLRTAPAPRADLKTSISTPAELVIPERFDQVWPLISQYLK